MVTEKKVIVADDEEAIICLIDRALKRKGYNVLTAKTGEEGIILYKGNIESRVLFFDEDMPGMKGTEAIKKVREIAQAENKNPYIVSMSGRIREIPEGADELLAKPFRLEDLYLSTERGFEKNETK